jgi:hypothetical protein
MRVHKKWFISFFGEMAVTTAGKENHKALALQLVELEKKFENQQKQLDAKNVSILTQFHKILPPEDLVPRSAAVCWECCGYCSTLGLIIIVGALSIAGGVFLTWGVSGGWAVLSRFLPGIK